MPWKTNNPISGYFKQLLLFLLVSFFMTGCASKPWTEPLKEKEANATTQIIDSLVARDLECGGTLEGDVVFFYQDPFEKKAMSGFLQFSQPSSYKFVITNPFGQPILVVAGDQDTFQAINTLEEQYLAGSLSSFGLRNDIPSYLLKGNWSGWLTGRNELSSQAITDIRNDQDSRGVWLTFQREKQAGVYHLLLDPDKEVFLGLILENAYNATVAEIAYDNWVTLGKCRQPLEINISGLDYGIEIRIELSNVLITDEKKTYRLKPPPGYIRRYMR